MKNESYRSDKEWGPDVESLKLARIYQLTFYFFPSQGATAQVLIVQSKSGRSIYLTEIYQVLHVLSPG